MKVARPRANPKGTKVRLSVTVDPDLAKWVERNVGTGKMYASRSHLVERALTQLKKGHRDE